MVSMNVFCIYAHEDPASFGAAMHNRILSYYEKNGHQVTVSDLYGSGFHAVAEKWDFKVSGGAHQNYMMEQARAAKDSTAFAEDIKEVITTFHEYRKILGKEVQQILPSLTNIDKERKNALNNLGKEYFDYIQSDSLAYFRQIEDFLEDPKNELLRDYYEDSTADLRAAITLGRSDFGPFEEVIEHLVEAVFSSVKSDLTNQRGLSGVKRTIRTLLHFMYYHCDIGVKDNVTAA